MKMDAFLRNWKRLLKKFITTKVNKHNLFCWKLCKSMYYLLWFSSEKKEYVDWLVNWDLRIMCVVHTYAYACWWPIMAIFHFLPFHTFLYYYFFCPLANHTHDAKVMKAQWPVKFYGRKKNCSLHLNELGFLRCKTRRWRRRGAVMT